MTEAEKLAQRLDYVASKTTSEAAALIRSLDASNKRMAEALRDFAKPKQSHYECEDGWYSCPAHPDYFGNDKSGECNCGADEHNARLERHADALRDAGVMP